MISDQKKKPLERIGGYRAVFTFHQERGRTVRVYTHGDGYPTDAAAALLRALPLAWPLPRFESNEFAAAFIAANKTRPGGISLCSRGEFEQGLFAYDITCDGRSLVVNAFCDSGDGWQEFFTGTLDQFAKAVSQEAA